jgi:hypothetical protein
VAAGLPIGVRRTPAELEQLAALPAEEQKCLPPSDRRALTNMRYRAESKRREEETAAATAATAQTLDTLVQATQATEAAAATAAAAAEEAAWEEAIQRKVALLQTQGTCLLTPRATVEANVRAYVKQARRLGCHGCHHKAGGCPGPFRPYTGPDNSLSFFDVTQFAHYSVFAKGGTREKEHVKLQWYKTSYAFEQYIRVQGRAKWQWCHKVESVWEGEVRQQARMAGLTPSDVSPAFQSRPSSPLPPPDSASS